MSFILSHKPNTDAVQRQLNMSGAVLLCKPKVIHLSQSQHLCNGEV